MAGQAAQEQETEDRVENSDTRDTFYGSSVRRDGETAVAEYRQKVREDGEDERAAAELDAADEPLQQLKREARFGAHDRG